MITESKQQTIIHSQYAEDTESESCNTEYVRNSIIYINITQSRNRTDKRILALLKLQSAGQFGLI